MKTLKLILTLILITSLATGCSSDDTTDNETEVVAEITGIWVPVQLIITDSNGVSTIDDFSDCEQRGRTTFISNGDFTQTGYFPVSGNCEIEFDNTGSWEIINDDTLRVTLNGQVDNGTIGDYLILELSETTLRFDSDLDPNSLRQEIYVFDKVN